MQSVLAKRKKRAAKGLVRTALELDQEEDRLHEFDFLVVGETDHDLLVLLGDREILTGDRGDRVFDIFLALESVRISGTVVPSVVILLIARLMVKYSFSAGSTRMPIRARNPTTTAQKSRPNSVTPR